MSTLSVDLFNIYPLVSGHRPPCLGIGCGSSTLCPGVVSIDDTLVDQLAVGFFKMRFSLKSYTRRQTKTVSGSALSRGIR